MFLDSKLIFKQHIEIRISKAKTAFYLIRRLGNTQRGLSLQALQQTMEYNAGGKANLETTY